MASGRDYMTNGCFVHERDVIMRACGDFLQLTICDARALPLFGWLLGFAILVLSGRSHFEKLQLDVTVVLTVPGITLVRALVHC